MIRDEQRAAAEEGANDTGAEHLTHEERLAQQDRWSDAAIDREPVIGRRGRRRLLWVASALLAVSLLIALPPLINVSRYQHRVASSISGSIGRAVRFDTISLHLLPFPGFTIENFVVYEDPSFGAEPAMRANRVNARIRLLSLWRRRVEVSHITMESPTVNLVRNAAGYWNMQGVVTQAAQVQSAPTAQPRAGSAPRFPYVEGTDARVNVKLGETKLPFALVDAEFALWLPSEQEWHLRMVGRPLRSDTDASDVGLLSLEATLSRKGGKVAQSPFTLQAAWKPTPLGEVGKLVAGSDTGWRGMASAELSLQGTPDAMHVATDVHLHDVRRAEFVPAETVQVDAHCEANALGMGRQLKDVHCAVPTGAPASLFQSLSFHHAPAADGQGPPDVLRLDAELPDVLDPGRATVAVLLPRAAPEWGMRWVRLFSRRMSVAAKVEGTLSFEANKHPDTDWTGALLCSCVLPPVAGQDVEASAQQRRDWSVRIAPAEAGDGPNRALQIRVSPGPEGGDPDGDGDRADTAQTRAVQPADGGDSGVSGTVSMNGSSLAYASAGLPREFAVVIPALADDMPAGLSGAVTAHRNWGGPQVWAEATPAPAAGKRRRPRHRK